MTYVGRPLCYVVLVSVTLPFILTSYVRLTPPNLTLKLLFITQLRLFNSTQIWYVVHYGYTEVTND